jgi:hypothetical protein
VHKTGRNEPCPCGSGVKYKRCHYPQDSVATGPRTINYHVGGSLEASGLPGAHADLTISPLGRDSTGPYSVIFTLMRPGQPLTPAEVLTSHQALEGDSQIAFAWPGQAFNDEIILYVEQSDGSKQTVHALPNKDGRLAKLRIDNVEGTSYEDARASAARTAHDVLSNLALMYDVPLETFQVDVIDENVFNQFVSVRMAFSTGIWDAPMVLGDEIRKYAALYREGIGSRNDLYSFLCFFKIIEAVDKLNTRDAHVALKNNEEPKKLIRQAMPESESDIREWVKSIFPGWYRWGGFEIGNVAPEEARGARLNAIKDKYLSPIRHLIAHGLLDEEGLVDVDDPELQKRVKYWLPYTRMMARRVLFARCLPDVLADEVR